jgi:HD-GYP domain-containing protein (c-di-GMP phosphodiesterase class II)
MTSDDLNLDKILESRLKASQVVVVEAEEDSGYVPLPLRNLKTDAVIPFEVYLKIKDKKDPQAQFVRVCPPGEVFQSKWRSNLLTLKVPWVYFRSQDTVQVQEYLNRNLETILADHDMPARKKAALVYDVTLLWVRHFFLHEQERTGQHLELALNHVDNLLRLIHQEQTQSSFVLDLWQYDQGLYTHSLNTCLLGLAFVSCLKWPPNQVRDFGLGALLHDIGMIQIPAAILRKPAKLSKEEEELIHKHPFQGFQILKKFSILRSEILHMVLQHHENGDGSGYPDRLQFPKIHPWARILRILDSYEALTAARSWRSAFAPKDALWIMREEWEKSLHFDQKYLSSFIKFLAAT